MDTQIDTVTKDFQDHTDRPEAAPPTCQRPFARRFVIREDDRALFVRASDIDYVQANGNYVHFHVKLQVFKLRATTRSIEECLDPTQFIRIHKSTIVNVDRISEIRTWFGGDYVAILADGRQLRVSRTYAPKLLEPIQ